MARTFCNFIFGYYTEKPNAGTRYASRSRETYSSPYFRRESRASLLLPDCHAATVCDGNMMASSPASSSAIARFFLGYDAALLPVAERYCHHPRANEGKYDKRHSPALRRTLRRWRCISPIPLSVPCSAVSVASVSVDIFSAEALV